MNEPELPKVESPATEISDLPLWVKNLLLMILVGIIFSLGVFIGSYHQEIVLILLQTLNCLSKMFVVLLAFLAFSLAMTMLVK